MSFAGLESIFLTLLNAANIANDVPLSSRALILWKLYAKKLSIDSGFDSTFFYDIEGKNLIFFDVAVFNSFLLGENNFTLISTGQQFGSYLVQLDGHFIIADPFNKNANLGQLSSALLIDRFSAEVPQQTRVGKAAKKWRDGLQALGEVLVTVGVAAEVLPEFPVSKVVGGYLLLVGVAAGAAVSIFDLVEDLTTSSIEVQTDQSVALVDFSLVGDENGDIGISGAEQGPGPEPEPEPGHDPPIVQPEFPTDVLTPTFAPGIIPKLPITRK